MKHSQKARINTQGLGSVVQISGLRLVKSAKILEYGAGPDGISANRLKHLKVSGVV